MAPNVVMFADASNARGTRLSSALEQAGYQVQAHRFGKIDPHTIARFKPLAVVFNVGHHSEIAYQLLSTLRKSKDLKDVVMIGIFGEKETGTGTHPESFDHCLGKSINLDALLSAIHSPRPTPHRVLLVEDHVSLAQATALLMRHEGLEVWIAGTGKDALEIANKVRPEIVLCDLNLPDMTGFDVVRKLRASPGAKDALIAIHTAMDEAALDAFKPGADPLLNMYLSKPLTVEKCNALVSRLRRRRSTARTGSRHKN